MSIPTEQQLIDADNYACKQLCTLIPSKAFNGNLTYWDNTMKACRITSEGCDANPVNPISRPVFSNNGTPIDLFKTEHNQRVLDFWNDGGNWIPDQYVMKYISSNPSNQVCARANNLLYQWCNYPATRTTGDLSGKGYSDVPPFEYTVRDGVETCVIHKDYCDNRGVSYNGTVGKEDCYVSTGQKVAEFFASDVLVRRAKRL